MVMRRLGHATAHIGPDTVPIGNAVRAAGTTWCTEPDSPSHEETGRRALAATKPLVCPFSMDLRVNSYPEYSGPTDFADAGTPGGGGARTKMIML